ncbi:MAG: mitochondrial fission ELM1 family protein [Caulobacteraceae bacterium]|nr:mitochondrial fission ELM1 family protein [Caulobacteraceae bacterium]
MPAPVIWYMTTGQAGFRTQARGLASRLGPEARELVVDLRAPWRSLPTALNPFALKVLTPGSDRPQPPWPDLLISCSRRAAAVSIAVRKASRGRTLTVHVQNPLADPAAFDLVVAMAHDGLSGANVISVPTALHDVTPERLAAAADAWRDRLARPGRSLVGVALGGDNRNQPFTPETAAPLIEGLDRLRRETGAALAITPSRRTPESVKAAFAARFGGQEGVFLWDMQGDNPYYGILALSDRLVATSDSVSMISEALATPHPVEVFGPDGGARHAQFLNGLLDQGLVRRFAGDPAPGPAGGPLDSTGAAAAAVRRLLEGRGF